MKNLFTQHPNSVGETYFEHLKIAGKSGVKLFWAGIACMLHAVFPFLFIDTASKTIKEIHQKITVRQTNISS